MINYACFEGFVGVCFFNCALRILTPQSSGYFEDPKTPLLYRFRAPSIRGCKDSSGGLIPMSEFPAFNHDNVGDTVDGQNPKQPPRMMIFSHYL